MSQEKEWRDTRYELAEKLELIASELRGGDWSSVEWDEQYCRPTGERGMNGRSVAFSMKVTRPR